MIILGKSNEDVGAQLEKLTKRLLESREYRNVATDTIGEGGNEVDVQAEIPSRIPSSQSSRRLIAECKAWANPISLPDWLKFLGKVFVEEAKVGNEVEGLFVSLSGVNGAVRGNYDSLRQRKQNVILLEGETLTGEISKLYGLPQSASVTTKLKQFTEQLYSSMDLAYYDEKFYWAFLMPDHGIAILTPTGEPADRLLPDDIKAMLVKRLSAERVIDLAAEKLAVERAQGAKKFLLSTLFAAGGNLTLSFIENENGGFSIAELKSAFDWCETKGWVCRLNDRGIALVFTPNDETDTLFEMLRFLVAGTLIADDWIRIARSKFFGQLLNENFFKEISTIQAGLVLDADFEAKLRQLIQISPSALARAIHPDPMIVTGRINQPGVLTDDKEDCQRLMRSFLRGLKNDFGKPILKHFFYDDCGLREIEVVEHYRLKDKDAVVLGEEVRERIIIGQADQSLGGGLLLIEALSRAPEPWDWPRSTENPKLPDKLADPEP